MIKIIYFLSSCKRDTTFELLATEYLSIDNKAKKELLAEALYSMQNPEHEKGDNIEYIENAIQQRVSFWKGLEDADYFNKED